MALGDERNTQPETVAPERQLARRQAAGQLTLERAIESLRITA